MTKRYEEARHVALLAGQTFRAERCHSGRQFSGWPDRDQIVRAVGLYICIAAMFQRGSVDVQSLLQGRTNTPGGPARPAIAERMEKRRSRATNAARNR